MRVKGKAGEQGAVVDVLHVFGEGTAAAWRCTCGGEDAIVSHQPHRLSCEKCGNDWPLVPFAQCRRQDLSKLAQHYRHEAERERRRPDRVSGLAERYDEIADAADQALLEQDDKD